MIATVCDERSPGVVLNWFYLDSTHLERLDEDPATYSSAEVDQRVESSILDDVLFSVRPEKSHYCSVRHLAVVVEAQKQVYLL